MSDTTRGIIKNLRPGSFVLIDGAPCKVDRVDCSKTGKHGSAKARLEAIGMFDGRRRSYIGPADEELEIPIMLKKKAQVLAITGGKAQIMDMETFEVFDLEIPEEMKSTVAAGTDMMYFEIVGIKTLKQLK
jgi:translation initiation factor 5A